MFDGQCLLIPMLFAGMGDSNAHGVFNGYQSLPVDSGTACQRSDADRRALRDPAQRRLAVGARNRRDHGQRTEAECLFRIDARSAVDSGRNFDCFTTDRLTGRQRPRQLPQELDPDARLAEQPASLRGVSGLSE